MRKEQRVRCITWNDYGISKNQQAELKAFCMQYREKKEQLRKESRLDEEERDIIREDCRMIEEAARTAEPALSDYILKSAVEDLTFEMLEYDRKLGRMPVGKTDFYGYKRLFYYHLKKQKMKHYKFNTDH